MPLLRQLPRPLLKLLRVVKSLPEVVITKREKPFGTKMAVVLVMPEIWQTTLRGLLLVVYKSAGLANPVNTSTAGSGTLRH